MGIPDLGRWFRTISALQPIQMMARATRPAVTRAGKHVPGGFGPQQRSRFMGESPALLALVDGERGRMRARLPRIAFDRHLHAYEAQYGLDRDLFDETQRSWSGTAFEPFVAAVRARALAVAIRSGAAGLDAELTRACRAVAAQLELHLLANHLLENGFALAAGGAVTTGIEADLWWTLGCAILSWQLDEQFLEDGGHFERSVSYHLALTGALLETIELARAGSRVVPPAWERCAQRAVDFIAHVHAPDGTYPLFNDAALDAAPTVSMVLALAATLGIAPRDKQAPLHHLAATGWVIARTPRAMLAFDVGPDGAEYCPGHAHADALTFELWLDGRRVVVDYGVAAYGEGLSRTRTRSTAVHNTVQLGENDAAEVWSAFRVGRRSSATLTACRAEDAALVLRAENRGYRHLPGSPVHTRELRLTATSLGVEDSVSNCAGWVSRLRFDAAALRDSALEVTSRGPTTTSRDHWHPDHGVAYDAVVYEQSPLESSLFRLEWR